MQELYYNKDTFLCSIVITNCFGFNNGTGDFKQQAIIWTNVDEVLKNIDTVCYIVKVSKRV